MELSRGWRIFFAIWFGVWLGAGWSLLAVYAEPVNQALPPTWIVRSSGYSSEPILELEYNAAEENRLEISSGNTHFGDGNSVLLDGSQVCTGASGCGYLWSDQEGNNRLVRFTCSGRACNYYWEVAGRHIPRVGDNPFINGGNPHWSRMPAVMPGVTAQGLVETFNGMVNLSGIFGGTLAMFLAITMLAVVFRRFVRPFTAGMSGSEHPGTGKGSKSVSSNNPYEEKGVD